LKEGATSRSKEDIREIRDVYLDLDEDAAASLARIRDSPASRNGDLKHIEWEGWGWGG
jgi:hypothetical protein